MPQSVPRKRPEESRPMTEPATVRMVEYADATPEVRAVFDDIMATKGIDFVPNAWKVFASHPPSLQRLWYGLKEVMAPGALDRSEEHTSELQSLMRISYA